MADIDKLLNTWVSCVQTMDGDRQIGRIDKGFYILLKMMRLKSISMSYLLTSMITLMQEKDSACINILLDYHVVGV